MRRQTRTGARALVGALAKAGAEVVFGYPGGNVLDIFDEIRASRLSFVLGRHEQGCVHMADGYARASGRPGVVLVTSGPGLTNAITGLGAANMDGVPLVCICGQVPLDQIGTDAFQEADTTGLTRAVSKHNFLVKSADEIPETVAQAFYIATHGKPGVVVIDVPRDCQRAKTAVRDPERVCLRAYHPEVYAAPREVNAFAKILNAAKRPLIYAGGGVVSAGASAELAALAHKAEIPVVTTMMGLGAIDERDPLALGMGGLYGTSAARRALEKADVIVALGVRFNDRTTGPVSRFARQAKILHIDCDASAIDKNVSVNLGIVADIREFLTTVDSRIRPAEHRDWCESLRTKPPRRLALDPHVIVTSDVGEHQLWAVKNVLHAFPRHFLASGGMGAMGFGIPAAIGAAIARPDRKVVAFVGDGGAQMTGEELIVAAERKLPVVFVVFSNRTLGLVRRMQQEELGGRLFATDLKNPDFLLLARAYGLRAMRVRGLGNLEGALTKALRTRLPRLLEVVL